MPMFYTCVPGATQTSNASGGTANDCFYVTPGATRTMWVNAIYPVGRANASTNVSGISYRLVNWTGSASTGGTAITPSPNDKGYEAAKHTAGYSATTVSSGTTGPTLLLSIGSGLASPGNWMAGVGTQGMDQAYSLPAAATQSLDIENVSAAASLVFELSVGTIE
jgi:hypothetical protein